MFIYIYIVIYIYICMYIYINSYIYNICIYIYTYIVIYIYMYKKYIYSLSSRLLQSLQYRHESNRHGCQAARPEAPQL